MMQAYSRIYLGIKIRKNFITDDNNNNNKKLKEVQITLKKKIVFTSVKNKTRKIKEKTFRK